MLCLPAPDMGGEDLARTPCGGRPPVRLVRRAPAHRRMGSYSTKQDAPLTPSENVPAMVMKSLTVSAASKLVMVPAE